MVILMIDKIRSQTNAVWEKYGWIIIIANLLFGIAFLVMIFTGNDQKA